MTQAPAPQPPTALPLALAPDPSATICVTVNGRSMDLPSGATVRSVIESLGLGKAACAAELNKALVPRRDHEARGLADGDALEIVSLVGGG